MSLSFAVVQDRRGAAAAVRRRSPRDRYRFAHPGRPPPPLPPLPCRAGS
nr:MAG TPA: hypothetical protein [Caudoviricetes sp.]